MRRLLFGASARQRRPEQALPGPLSRAHFSLAAGRRNADGGPGLAVAVRETLFEPLTLTKANGMGVGPSISKSIIEAHSGRIWGGSAAAGGAVFGFALPLEVAGSDE